MNDKYPTEETLRTVDDLQRPLEKRAFVLAATPTLMAAVLVNLRQVVEKPI